jgi:hypothetical protein
MKHRCEECGNEYDTPQGLGCHMRKHRKKRKSMKRTRGVSEGSASVNFCPCCGFPIGKLRV